MHRRINRRMISRMLAVAALLVVVGCSSKLTTANYDKLKMGMTYEEVVAILGKADECDGAMGLKTCRWGDDKRQIRSNSPATKSSCLPARGFRNKKPGKGGPVAIPGLCIKWVVMN